VLVVDQMRNDYIDDYGGPWTNGLRRLLREGARFRNAAYPYLNTVTCAGHATISTGTLPAFHGIILNQWWHRDEQKELSCTDDPAAPIIRYGPGPATGGHSPKRLLVPAFAQALERQQGNKARIVTVSMKARSAIMLAGGRADAVTWFDSQGFVTSAAFTDKRVPVIDQFLRSVPIDRDDGRTWDRLRPVSTYRYTDDGEAEKPPSGWTRTFPHQLGRAGGAGSGEFYRLWESSPWSDEYLERMAEAAIDGFHLGQEATTDFLGVSFSALDSVGHRFGPRSHEVQDLLARLDVTIGRLLTHLDARVGHAKYVLALSADHGVAVIPEQLKREGKDAGRAIMDAVVARVEATLTAAYGPGKYVAKQNYTNLYLASGVFARLAADQPRFDAVVKAIGQVPGVSRVIDTRTLNPRAPAADPLVRAAALSEFPGRSGDLVIVPKLYWFWVADDGTSAPGDATTHGTAYPYDTRVPLLLFGAAVQPGQYDADASPADIAPTLARFASVPLPSATGRVLGEAISSTSTINRSPSSVDRLAKQR
jgi:predicted AlkP superfamily pyrophosphatase or phosphodiesterase